MAEIVEKDELVENAYSLHKFIELIFDKYPPTHEFNMRDIYIKARGMGEFSRVSLEAETLTDGSIVHNIIFD